MGGIKLDCTFETTKGTFNYRVGAIITCDKGLLVVEQSKEKYFYSVGGRVNLHETIDEAIEREVIEETGSSIKQKTLAFIHENFFTSKSTGKIYHEVSFYYSVELFKKVSRTYSDEQEKFHWIPFDRLAQTDIRPNFLKELTKEKSRMIQHIVQRE